MATTSNNIPQGYKATALGIIPQEWEVKFLGDLLSRCANGLTYDVSITSGIPVTRIETISTGEINYAKVGYIPNESGYETFRMQKGDILYSHINSLSQIGKVAYYKGDKEIYHGMNLLLLRANKSLDKQYLYYTLLTDHMRHMAQVIAKPAVNQASISTSDLKRVKIAVPPLGEQRKIAEVLGVWDEAIEKQARLIEKLALRKRALMQRLLSAKLRLPGFSEPWKEHKIADLFSPINDTNDGREHIPMTISAKSGFISQKDKFDRVIAGDSLQRYILLKKGDFAYNKGNSNLYEMGCIYHLNEESALVPFVYICFRSKGSVNIDFYSQFFINHGLDRQLKKIITSGARGDGLLNVDKKDFFALNVPYPTIEEQTAIAEVLTAADREIELAKEKRTPPPSETRPYATTPNRKKTGTLMMEKGLIYHYTTIEALDKIILDTTNADKKICLLASNYEYVNDPYEISHGFEVSCKYLPEVESALDIAPEDRIAEKVNASLSNIKKETLFSPDSDLSLYITCFSENKDCLPMWNMYGNNGSGISLGLHWAPCLFSPERLRKVMYDNDRDGIVEFLKTYYKHQKDQIRDTMKKGDIRFIKSALFRYVGAYIKHHKYAYEAEYRYVIHKELITKTADGYTEKIKFRVRNGDLIPYCELFFPSSVLEQIIIGPTRNFARTENALKMFLRARNLQSVKIIRSEVPFIG